MRTRSLLWPINTFWEQLYCSAVLANRFDVRAVHVSLASFRLFIKQWKYFKRYTEWISHLNVTNNEFIANFPLNRIKPAYFAQSSTNFFLLTIEDCALLKRALDCTFLKESWIVHCYHSVLQPIFLTKSSIFRVKNDQFSYYFLWIEMVKHTWNSTEIRVAWFYSNLNLFIKISERKNAHLISHDSFWPLKWHKLKELSNTINQRIECKQIKIHAAEIENLNLKSQRIRISLYCLMYKH